MHALPMSEREISKIVSEAREAEYQPLLGSEYIFPAALAAELRVSTRTLDRLYTQRIGPPRVVIAGRILYRRQAVLDWLATREGNRPARKRGHKPLSAAQV